MPPRNAQREGDKRYYPWRGQNFYSVTTIRDAAIRKYALEKWGPKMVAQGVVRERRVLLAMLDECTTPDECRQVADPIDLCKACNGTVAYLKDLPYVYSKRAADIGTYVHTAIENYTLGRPHPPWPLAIRPRMQQFQRFLKDWRPTFELAEATIYNRRFAFAGTLDAILTLPVMRVTPMVAALQGWPADRDPRLLIDYKTSARGIYPEVALQLAAYRNGEFIGLADGSEQPLPAVDGTAALQLTDEDYHFKPVVADDQVYNVFLHARSLFRWADDISKHVVGEDLQPAVPLEVVA